MTKPKRQGGKMMGEKRIVFKEKICQLGKKVRQIRKKARDVYSVVGPYISIGNLIINLIRWF